MNNFDHIGAKRGESSPSFQDLPSSEEINIDECGDSRTTMPTSVTSPLGTEMLEFPDFKEKKGLNSPSLVSTLGSEGLSLATASPLNNFSAIKFPGSSGSSGTTQISQSEKKVSSSVKKMSSSSSTMSGGTGGVNYTQSTEHSSETASASVSKRFVGRRVFTRS